MLAYKESLKRLLVDRLKDDYPLESLTIEISDTPRIELGDLALALPFQLAKVLKRPPDVGAMARAASLLPGQRDFASFAVEPEPGESTECRLERLDVAADGGFLYVDVIANRFLRKMVRTLVGTLLEIGWGKRAPEWIEEVLEARDRSAAGPTVPPRGLVLLSVEYPDALSPEGEVGKR